MTETLKIASAQLNPHVGFLKSNIEKAHVAYERAKSDKAEEANASGKTFE